MNVLKIILLIGNPLLLAFISSVIIGALCKKASAILMLKRVVSLTVFGIAFLAYYYLAFVVKGAAMYIAMFAPLAVMLIFIVVSIIAAPKDKIKEQSKEEYKMTGWDTMFPNDIDNDNNFTN